MTAIASLPRSQNALKIVSPNTFHVDANAPLPTLVDHDSVLIRVVCVAINPVDGKSADLSATAGATSGTDFAGIVVALPPDTNSEPDDDALKIGDRVMGFVFGNNPQGRDNGAFAEYVTVPRRLLWRLPAHMSLETAASLPASLASVGMAMHYLQIPLSSLQSAISKSIASSSAAAAADDEGPFVLVYGGGTSTGCMAIQILRLAGFVPVTCCSSSSAARALSLGAAATFDYASATCGRDVREHTHDSLALAIDCISDSASMSICYEAIGGGGGRYVALDPFPVRGCVRRSVVPDWICTLTQFGRPVAWAPPYNIDERPGDRRFAEEWYRLAQRMLDAHVIRAPTLETRTGGLASVPEGISEVRMGEVKRKKLVYNIVEQKAAA
ncbi:DmbC [Cordyceps fumosorosea ARSEF 2679]|nr:DmbC [Cordyceps fumosorosea ARSEF 2679]OAA53530.1 DmbC [Cordyceps fumosorosea ARSEF 2679]